MMARTEGVGNRAQPPASIDDYLAALPDDARAALSSLRRIIRTAAPEAVEVISYGIPSYKYQGYLVGFAAFKNHCSFFPGRAMVDEYREELRAFKTAKGTIRFTPDRPLPTALVRKIVRTRIEENETRASHRRGPKQAGRSGRSSVRRSPSE